MSWIDAKTCEQERRLAFFAKFNMMQLDCKKRLAKDERIYFQDLIVFLKKKIIGNAVENLYYCDCKIVKAKTYLQ